MIGAVIGEEKFFLCAFAKNKRSNISYQEKLALRELAYSFLHFNTDELEELITNGELVKVETIQEGDNHE